MSSGTLAACPLADSYLAIRISRQWIFLRFTTFLTDACYVPRVLWGVVISFAALPNIRPDSEFLSESNQTACSFTVERAIEIISLRN